jgi:D-alanyl-lipoteichoic acid acyltransferase DltB (MBOAT superfamily)
MWVITGVLLLVCAFIESVFSVEWAQSWQTYLIIAAVSFSYGCIELLLRGAYYERNGMTGWGIPYLIAGLSFITTVWHIVDFARGEEFIRYGIMTEEGGYFVIGLLLLVFGIVGVIKSLQLRNHWEKPDEE